MNIDKKIFRAAQEFGLIQDRLKLECDEFVAALHLAIAGATSVKSMIKGLEKKELI